MVSSKNCKGLMEIEWVISPKEKPLINPLFSKRDSTLLRKSTNRMKRKVMEMWDYSYTKRLKTEWQEKSFWRTRNPTPSILLPWNENNKVQKSNKDSNIQRVKVFLWSLLIGAPIPRQKAKKVQRVISTVSIYMLSLFWGEIIFGSCFPTLLVYS